MTGIDEFTEIETADFIDEHIFGRDIDEFSGASDYLSDSHGKTGLFDKFSRERFFCILAIIYTAAGQEIPAMMLDAKYVVARIEDNSIGTWSVDIFIGGCGCAELSQGHFLLY